MGSRHKFISVSADVFFFNSIEFRITVAIKLNFVSVEHTPVCTAKSLVKNIKCVLQVYDRAEFTVIYLMMDREFEKVKELLLTIVNNTASAKEHVSEAERKIRVVKERNRGVVNTLPFTYIPRRMKIEFIYFVTLWLNAFPVKNSVSETFSPREILLLWRMDAKKHCRVLPGS